MLEGEGTATSRYAVRAALAGAEDMLCKGCDIALRLFGDAMNDLVDRILTAYQLTRAQDGELVADSRRKITGYIESLAAAGQRDAKQLTVYGLAYLKELHEGRDPRFTGC